MSMRNVIPIIFVIEGEPTYPDTVTISSTGGAVDSQTSCLGVYTKTYQIHSGRPVWKNTARDDRFLFYNGKRTLYFNKVESTIIFS